MKKEIGIPPEMSQQALYKSLLAGDPIAWENCIKSRSRLWGGILRNTGVRFDDIDDVIQIGCMRIYTALPRLQDTTYFDNWMVTVIRNAGISYLRHLQVFPTDSLSPLIDGEENQRKIVGKAW